jgi:hypothetical protein
VKSDGSAVAQPLTASAYGRRCAPSSAMALAAAAQPSLPHPPINAAEMTTAINSSLASVNRGLRVTADQIFTAPRGDRGAARSVSEIDGRVE